MRTLALLSGGILSAAVLTACNEGATEPPVLTETAPTPSEETTATLGMTVAALPTSTADPDTGGMDGFRAFAPLIEAALAEGDASFFADRGVEDEVTCAGDEPLGPCADQPAGAVLRGIPSGMVQSQIYLLTPQDEYAGKLLGWFADAMPDRGDEYGDGGVGVYALAYRPASTGVEEAYQAIVTGIFARGTDAFRQARILSLQFRDDGWRLVEDMLATVASTAEPYLSGECTACYDAWERWEGAP